MTLCTLFNVNYLDKGIVLYESLEKISDDFTLYVLAMDDKCYEILLDLNYKYLVPIKLKDFEDDELLRVKPHRSLGEYCWTCSSSLIRYVLITFQPEYCTYIDADLYFYSNPQIIIDEMKAKNASVQVVGHRFNKKNKEYQEWLVGKYCVEFNTFKNDENGLMLINKWRNQCLDHCSTDGDGVYWGDQKYLDKWVEDYEFVIETENLGAGIAPWNVMQYKRKNGKLYCNDLPIELIFYHFENIQYLSRNKVKTNIQNIIRTDFKLIKDLYIDYLQKIDSIKTLLKAKYGIDIVIKYHPGTRKDAQIVHLSTWVEYLKDLLLTNCYVIKY